MNKQQQNIRFFNRWANIYDNSFPISFWLKRMQKDVLKFIVRRPKLKILDVSCGTGELLLSLSRRIEKPSLFGVDISVNMLKIAEKKLGNKANLKYSSADKLPFKNDTFHYVITTEAFHHYTNQEKSIQEMKRVLKPNGRLIIADINLFLAIFHKIFEFFEPGCIKINSRKESIRMFQRNGFKNIRQLRTNVCGIITTGIK